MCWTTTTVYYTDKYWTNTLASFLEIEFKPHLNTSSACVNFCGFHDIKVKLVVGITILFHSTSQSVVSCKVWHEISLSNCKEYC